MDGWMDGCRETRFASNAASESQTRLKQRCGGQKRIVDARQMSFGTRHPRGDADIYSDIVVVLHLRSQKLKMSCQSCIRLAFA